jgi:hypothetical protein
MPRRPTPIRMAALSLAALAAACAQPSAVPSGPAPAGPRPTAAGHPGFDTGTYPGDAGMRAWRAGSPYEWVGYYLPAPCHRDLSWSGKRDALIAMGWGTAVIYVGQQDWAQMNRAPAQTPATDTTARNPQQPADTAATRNPPPAQQQAQPGMQAAAAPACSATLLATGRGTTDADDAIAKAAAEGFPAGTTIYLDVERVQSVSMELVSYVREWTLRVLQEGRYVPGLYVHRINADPLASAAQSAWLAAGRSDAPRVWVTATDPAFNLDQSPRASGVSNVTIWQGRLDVTESYGGTALRVDQNVSETRSPSAPR